MYSEYNMHDTAVYAGYLNDDNRILQSASGGIATALSEYMIQQGGYVAGVTYSKDFSKAEYIIVDNINDIKKLKGSKYIDCDKNNIYSDVKKLIDSGEKVIFFGLPCIVGALYKYIGSRPDYLLTCELICHGPTYAKVHSDYITFLENKYKSNIVEFSVRHKNGLWTPSYLYAKFQNGEIFQKEFFQTEYGYAFSVLSKESCYNCKFKGNNRQADIMIGDFWGANKNDIFWNKCGVSSILAETEKGNMFLKATPGITLFDSTFERVVEQNPMIIKPRNKKENSDRFAELLIKNDLFYAVKHSVSLKKRIIKFINKLIPNKIRTIIKFVFKKAIKSVHSLVKG